MDISPKSWTTKEISQAEGSPQSGRSIVVFDNIEAIANLKFPLKTDFLLSIVCLRGSLKLTVDLIHHVIPDRALMVLRPGHVINDYSASNDFKGFFILVTLKALNGALPSLSKLQPCVQHFHNNSILRLSDRELISQQRLHHLLQEKIHGEDYPYKEKVIQALGEAIFYETLGLYTARMQSDETSSKRKDELLYQFISLVEKNFNKHRDVIFYADKLCVSAKHLSSVVKSVSGRTAGQWIDSYVILEAKMQLRNTTRSIQEISSSLSFSDQSFFGKYFKRLTGMSPREFRASNA